MSFILSCKKEQLNKPVEIITEQSNSVKYSVDKINSSLEKISQSVAKSLENKNLRKLLKQEFLKKFDGDYDVLYNNVSEKIIEDLTVRELIEREYQSLYNSKNESIDMLISDIPKFQLAFPINI